MTLIFGGRSHVRSVIQAERFGSKHNGQEIRSLCFFFLRYTLESIYINAVIVTNVNGIEKLLHGNYCGVMSTCILEINTGEHPYQCSYCD